MLFNSLSFLIFLPIVFLLYWFLTNKNLRLQNTLLLVASYFFYACWDYRFLFLLLFSTLLDFYSGLKIERSGTVSTKRFWFWLSISINLGFLAIFKYYNFFAESFAEGLSQIGLQVNPRTLTIILPVGISFYTFHGLSYIIDCYRGGIQAEKNIIDYSLFVSFFPLLVAGPIERATHLLPQLKKQRHFDYSKAVDGLRQILWGLFKKVVIADNCAAFANPIFDHADQHSGSTLLLGAVFFSVQIYGDFSGYSDIALGTARLFGIELLKNFSYPYFSRDIAEFWRRWHISLSSWFRDYLYIPMGGSQGGTFKKIRNTFIIFIVSGFWHGANWTFIAWGLLNALYFLPLLLMKNNRSHLDTIASDRLLPNLKELVQMSMTFTMTVFAWIFFRAESLSAALQFISGICNRSLFSIPSREALTLNHLDMPTMLLLLTAFLLIEWLGRSADYALAGVGLNWKPPFRKVLYYCLSLTLLFYGGQEQEFIYFQF